MADDTYEHPQRVHDVSEEKIEDIYHELTFNQEKDDPDHIFVYNGSIFGDAEEDTVTSMPTTTQKTHVSGVSGPRVVFRGVIAIIGIFLTVSGFVLFTVWRREAGPSINSTMVTSNPTTPSTTTLSPNFVILTINGVPVIEESFTFQCTVVNVQSLYEIEFLRDGQTLATLNTSSSLATVTQSSMAVDGHYDNDTYKAEVTLKSVACSDSGNYMCIAKGNGSEGSQTAILQVRRIPITTLTLEVPPSAERMTWNNPVCRAASLGYNPVMIFRWVLIHSNGIKERQSSELQTDTISTIKETCTSSGSSTLDAQRYIGWNNTDLCCQLTDPNNSMVANETCQRILTLPADFCSSRKLSHLLYPYEPCYTYVQCVGATIYFNFCPILNGFCFDIKTISCSLNPPTTTTTYALITTLSSKMPSSTTITTKTTLLPTQNVTTTLLSTNFTEPSVSPSAQVSTTITSNITLLTTSNITSTIQESNTTESTTALTTIMLPPIVVNFTVNDVAVIGESFTFQCTVRNVQSLYEIKFLRDGQTLAVLNTSSSLATMMQSNMSINGHYDNNTYKLEVTLNPVACSDFGKYECIANGNNSEDNQTAVLQVKRLDTSLTLEVPSSAQRETMGNPICRAASLGYNPRMTFTWVLMQPNGTQEMLSRALQTDVTSTNATSCTSSGNSTLDAQSYTGWNNSDLCCHLTDPNNSSLVVNKACQKIQTLPVDTTGTTVSTSAP